MERCHGGLGEDGGGDRPFLVVAGEVEESVVDKVEELSLLCRGQRPH